MQVQDEAIEGINSTSVRKNRLQTGRLRRNPFQNFTLKKNTVSRSKVTLHVQSLASRRHPAILRGMSDVTLILSKIESGELQASDELLPLVYDELRKLAAAKMAKENPGHTLQATALVHDAYLRLVDVKKAQHWESRGHFFAAAAEAMRRILVDQARQKKSVKSGGDLNRIEFSLIEAESPAPQADLLALSEAIDDLAAKDHRKAELVKLRFFAGLTNEQAALALGISERTAFQDWSYAKAFLHVEVSK